MAIGVGRERQTVVLYGLRIGRCSPPLKMIASGQSTRGAVLPENSEPRTEQWSTTSSIDGPPVSTVVDSFI